MPGTILLSVIGFIDLPSSSPSSSISIKVSMGKREYQAWDKGDFSFPLTTLRDNLVVLLQDGEGNEISHAGIETKSIVEKGLWDDFFALKGGGFMHMKLQFVLNEEERTRIRMMRESALKKKHAELINSSPSNVQSTPSVGMTAASSLRLHKEISDRNAETSSAMTMQQRADFPLAELCPRILVEKIKVQPLPANGPARAIPTDEPARLLRSSQSMVGSKSLPNLQDMPHSLEKQSPFKKTASNVKKMISAFESGSAEDTRSHIKPLPTNVQSDNIKTGAPLKIERLKEDKEVNTETVQLISKGLVNPFSSRDLQLDSKPAQRSVEQINLLGPSDGTKPSVQDTGIKKNFKALPLHQEVDAPKETFYKDVVRTSKLETVRDSEKILGKHAHQPCDVLHGKRDSGGNLVIEESRIELSSTSSQIIEIQGTSASANVCTSAANFENRHIEGDNCPNVCTSEANCDDRHIPFESSGSWIFPDEAIRFCITTSCKKVMDLLGGCSMKPDIHQGRTNCSLPENVEEHNVDSDTGLEVITNEKNQRPRKLKVENLEEIEAETSGGPVGQAIKVAIMIGFGTLVLLTRQRRNR